MPLLDSEIFFEKATFRLRSDVSENLQAYARYLSSTPDHILNSALSFVFSKDKEFQDWKLREANSAGEALPQQPKRRKRGVPESTVNEGRTAGASNFPG